METRLARAPGLWEAGPIQLELPFEAKGIAGLFRASGRLHLTPDLDVFAWVCERWLATPPLDPEGIARFTLYDLGCDLYGKKPTGRHRQLINDSLRRLYRIEVGFTDHNVVDGGTAGWSLSRLFFEVGATARREGAGRDPRRIGALRNATMQVRIAPWLRDALVAGFSTYLNWATLRQLEGIAKRIWVYLQAESYKPIGDGRSATHVGLGQPALACLGVDGYERHRDARAALNRAGQRIVKADRRYESVRVEPRPGGYALVAVKLDAEEVRRREAERAAIRARLAADGW